MQSKFTIMRNNRKKLIDAKQTAHDRVRAMVLQGIERQRIRTTLLDAYYTRPPFVWWNPKTWRL